MAPMPKLTNEEETIVQRMVERKFRYCVLAEDHAAAVRKLGPDVIKKASEEASIALEPNTGGEIKYPPRGTNMEEYYKIFEPTLTHNAQTPFEHMYIALVAAGLMAVITACEYIYLSEEAQHEFIKRSSKLITEHFNPRLDEASIDQPPILSPIEPDAKLQKLQPMQVEALLKDFSKLHLQLLSDLRYGECYRVMDVEYATSDESIIESYEVQMEGCRSAITISFYEVKEMLYRSSLVLQ